MLDVKYLETSEPGLFWLRNYDRQNGQLNFDHAITSLFQAEQVLAEFPMSGERFEDYDDVREYHITHTAFSLLYTVARETIWIIDVRDTRGIRSADTLNAFNTGLKPLPVPAGNRLRQANRTLRQTGLRPKISERSMRDQYSP